MLWTSMFAVSADTFMIPKKAIHPKELPQELRLKICLMIGFARNAA